MCVCLCISVTKSLADASTIQQFKMCHRHLKAQRRAASYCALINVSSNVETVFMPFDALKMFDLSGNINRMFRVKAKYIGFFLQNSRSCGVESWKWPAIS